MNETQLECVRCGCKNRIPLHQPYWIDDLMGHSPSSMYGNDYKLSDLLKINELIGEQNEILKRELINLRGSLDYFIKKSKEKSENNDN